MEANEKLSDEQLKKYFDADIVTGDVRRMAQELIERRVCDVSRRLPGIEIDNDAIRFTFRDGSGTNLFWLDLFSSNRDFQNELARNILKAYCECVKNEITPDYGD